MGGRAVTAPTAARGTARIAARIAAQGVDTGAARP